MKTRAKRSAIEIAREIALSPTPLSLPTPHTITARDVVRFLRERAELRVEAWKQATNADPLHAFEWGVRDAIEAATMVKVCTYAIQALDNGVKDLRAHCHAQAAAAIQFPVASTGLLDDTIQSYTAAAWARIAADLRLEGTS